MLAHFQLLDLSDLERAIIRAAMIHLAVTLMESPKATLLQERLELDAEGKALTPGPFQRTKL